jgi:aldose 1-epimerase
MSKITQLFLLLVFVSCNSNGSEDVFNTSVKTREFQTEINGNKVDLFTLKGDSIEVQITNYGGRIVTLSVPDKNGRPTDVVLGFPSLDGYLNANEAYHGALIGRFANRIRAGRFTIDSTNYQLSINNPPNSLHGGPNGFHNVVWRVDSISDRHLALSYISQDMEEGYPGTLKVEVGYRIHNENTLEISYRATTDKRTVINLTSHPFFNLNGEGSGNVGDHYLKINASKYSPVDSTLIPLENNESVVGTPFDFQEFHQIKERIDEEHDQLTLALGYDHNYMLDKGLTKSPLSVAKAYSPTSKIKMWVYTTEPGLQFYGGNFLNGSDVGKSGSYRYREAFCLESQHFPDSPNRPDFPTTVLEPGEVFTSVTRYRFGITQ